jgi:hypothetical protein
MGDSNKKIDSRSAAVVFQSSNRSIILHAKAQRSWRVGNQEEPNTLCGFSQPEAALVAMQGATEARSHRLALNAASLFQSA